MDDTPPIAWEVARLLKEEGWTVRKLRAEKFGTPAAVKLLDPAKGTASAPTMERALRLTGRMLWHRGAPMISRPSRKSPGL